MNQQKPQTPESSPSTSTEVDYLAEQARQAASAIGSVFSAFKSDLAKGVDPATLAKQHPWIALGAAAVAGFAAASTVIPSKEEQALKKLSRIERALHPEPFASAHTPPPAQPAPEPQSITSRIFAELLSTLKPALSSALAAYAATRTPHHDGNGHPPQTDPNPT